MPEMNYSEEISECNIENIEIPNGITLPTHRRELRKALLTAKHPRKSNLFEEINMNIKKVLQKRSPVWQMALACILLVGLTAGLTLSVPTMARQDKQNQAKDIALNSLILKEALGGRDTSDINPEIDVALGNNGLASVTIESKSPNALTPQSGMPAWRINMSINVDAGKIISYYYTRDNVTETETQQINSILNSDTRTAALMSGGAKLDLASSNFMGVFASGNTVQDNGDNIIMSVSKLLTVGIKLQDWNYAARLDIAADRIVEFGDPNYSLLSSEELGTLTTILKSKPEIAALFEQGAVIRMVAVPKITFSIGTNGTTTQVNKTLEAFIYLGNNGYEAVVDMQSKSVVSFAPLKSSLF
jgi:hypothetical protein